ncbi:MAG: hypothetical protein ACOCUV_02350 [bacterium]
MFMREKLLTLILVLILAPILGPQVANSAEIITETTVNLGDTNTYFENLYIGAGSTNISSEVNSELTIIGGETFVSSKVTGDVFVAGGEIEFSGQVEVDLRIIGGDVRITGDVFGDILIIGGNVYVDEQATLLNDVMLVGGDIDFQSDSNKRLKVVAGKVFVDGMISGNSEITTQSLVIGSNSDISGNFSYYSPKKFDQQNGANITAEINYNKINTIRDTGIIKNTIVNFLNFWLLLKFITTLVLAFILVHVFKVFSVRVNNILSSSFFKSILVGLLTTFLLPIIILIFFISLVGLPIGLLLGLIFTILILIAPAVSGVFIGSWIRKIFNKTNEYAVDFHSAALGVILYTILQFVPVVGGFIRFVVLIAAFGAMIRFIRKSLFR